MNADKIYAGKITIYAGKITLQSEAYKLEAMPLGPLLLMPAPADLPNHRATYSCYGHPSEQIQA